jgi:hypothetical protein
VAGEILIATETVLTTFDGADVYITAGQTTARAGHPILKGREAMFTPVQVTWDMPEPEQKAPARAAPPAPAAKKAGAGQ